MNRLSSPAYLHAMSTVPGVLAHGPTPEQLTAAEMHLAAQKPSAQLPLFYTAPPTRESCPVDVPSLQAGRRGSFVGQ